MEVPAYPLAERDRRWALARKLMAAEDADALIAYGAHECAGEAGLAPDSYFSNDLPGSVVIFCGDADPVPLVTSNLPVQAHLKAARRGCPAWIGSADIRVGADAAGIAEVLRERRLEHAAVGVLGPGTAAPWHPELVAGCPLWREVLARLPRVRLKPADRSLLFATVCLSLRAWPQRGGCRARGEPGRHRRHRRGPPG